MNKKLTHVILLILIVAVSVLIFYKTTKYAFVAGDFQLIYHQQGWWDNLGTLFGKPFSGDIYEPIPFYRPVITFINFASFDLIGQNALWYHLTNLGLHILNAIFLYILVFLLFKRELLSLLTALFFAAHPIHTNSVVWISGRTDLIACFFIILTVILFVKWKDSKGNWRALLFGGAILTYLLALFSKEMALALPLFLFVWDYLSEKDQIKKKIIPHIPFIVVAILYVIWRIAVIGNLGTGEPYTSANLFQRFLTAFAIYFYYFKKFIFPVYLNFSPRVLTITSLFSLKFWGALVFFAVVFAIGFSFRKVAKEISFGIFWILIALIPVLNLVPIYASVKEWWAYIPSIGFFLILGRLAEVGISWERKLLEIKMPKRKPKEEKMPEAEETPSEEVPMEEKEVPEMKGSKFPQRIMIRAGHAFSLFFALLLLFYAFTIQSRARVFRNDYLLWTNTSKIAPYDAVAHNGLGMIIKKKGVTRWAKIAFQRAVQADPNFAEARNNLGTMLETMDQDDSALVQIKEAIRLDPGFIEAYNNLGIVYGKKMEYDSAIVAFRRAIELYPAFFPAWKNLGVIYDDMGDFPQALRYFETALKLAPNAQEAEAVKQRINQIKVQGYR